MSQHVLTMVGGQDVVFRKVSDLQRGYTSVLGELAKGRNVVMQRGEDLVAVIIDPGQYNDLVRKSSRVEEVERELAHMKAMIDLALAGGPSLAEARAQVAAGQAVPIEDVWQALLGGS